MAARKQRKRYRKGPGQEVISKDMLPVTYTTQLDPTFSFSSSPNNAIILQIRQWIKLLFRLEPSLF
jgi:hypothetical protein